MKDSGKVDVRLSSLPTYASTSTARLQALYSDIGRQKASNPTSFQSNVEWWKRTLEALVSHGLQSSSSDILILQAGPHLSESLRYEGVGKPLGLAAVVTDLRLKHTLIPLQAFTTLKSSIYDPGSIAYRIASFVVGKPLWWALQQMNIVDADDSSYVSGNSTQAWKDAKGSYVVVPLVEKAADIVLEKQRLKAGATVADSLYSMDSFRKEYGSLGVVFDGVALSETDLGVLVKFLSRDRQAAVVDREIIKFIDTDIELSEQMITAVDRGILELKSGVENLEAQVEDIQAKIKERTAKAADALKANRKEVALSHLKSRKHYEELLSKRLGALETLQATLIQVETAAGDVEIMKQYESSTATLRAILSDPHLQREKVEETLDAMAEARDDQRAIDEVIRSGMSVDVDVDEKELEDELAGLIADVKAEERQKEKKEEEERERERVSKVVLPDVPDTNVVQPLPKSSVIGQAQIKAQEGDIPTSSRSYPEVPPKATTPAPSAQSDWEQNWQKGQAEKEAQAIREKEAEMARRARWETEAA